MAVTQLKLSSMRSLSCAYEEFKEKDLSGVAPLLCAGITTYSPLHHWNVGKNSRVGVAELVV